MICLWGITLKKTVDNFVYDNDSKEIIDELKDLRFDPEAACSPFVIYGNNRVGKSHLCKAIRNDWENVEVYSAEDISYHLINVIEKKRSEEYFFDSLADRNVLGTPFSILLQN